MKRILVGLLILVVAMAASAAPAAVQYKEAPMLAALVAKGQLPPVDQRLPKNPKVIEMIEGIGKYGGDLVVFAVNENIWEQDLQGQMGSSLFRVPRSGIGIEPDLAAGYEINSDRTAITVFLREGLKWSNGQALTSEDIRFTFEDMHFWNPPGQVQTYGAFSVDAVKVINDYAIQLISPEGLGVIPLNLADWKEMATLGDEWQNTDMGTAEYRRMGIELFNWLVNDWWGWIGMVGEVPSVIISKNKLGNVIKPGWVTGLMVSDLLMQTWMDQLYWK